jgi:hypothetical protein
MYNTKNCFNEKRKFSIAVAEQSKARVCSRSLFDIACSNPAGVMYVCLFCVLCCHIEVSAKGPIPSPEEYCV